MPYGWEYASLVILQALTVALVRDPAGLPRIARHPLVEIGRAHV